MTRLRCSFTAEFKLEAVSLLLTGYFCERYRQAFGLPQVVMSPALCLALLHYYWPGNVRELEHAVHRAIVLARATSNSDELLLQPHHFSSEETAEPAVSPEALPTEADQDLRTATDTFQAGLIRTALTRSDGSWAVAARRLGIDAGNLHRLAKRLGLK
ncbi:transcriptional regulator [Aeromonas dhakensis]|nr:MULTISPECIES: hypothetical protein [Aeromonas]ANB70421.1 transcriptional regulator [Aeromonas veronii]AGM42914.1 anaerobic nitric oxide reductase transcription regulator [Aeromonas hydrophila ML09-119]AHX31621.1 transcriptional regulator [Aeromonas hydrophila subsp. hydrophila AL09-71]AHX68417.1 transcriptional regulator [Aeromonas hydrophila pc104A]AJE37547.1 transcriptional regulator [Aeromonas hydrophila J-1]